MSCCQNTPLQTVTIQLVTHVHCAKHYHNTQCVAVRNTPLQNVTVQFVMYPFSVHKFTVTHIMFLSEHNITTVTVQFVMYVQCAQHYCNTQCVAVRTHRYRPSQYNLLCTFSVHKFTGTQNVLLSERTVTYIHSTICYVC